MMQLPMATKKVKSVLSETNGNIITKKGVDPFKDFYDYKSSSKDEDEEDGDYTGWKNYFTCSGW